MRVVESIGLSRSGHHSMKNWIIRNMIGFQIGWDYKLTVANGTKFYHLGEANHDIPLSYEYLDQIKNDAEFLLINYEDTPWDYTLLNEDRIFHGKYRLDLAKKYNIEHEGRVVFIRDFYNNLTSRIKSNQRQIFNKWNEDKPHLFKVDGVFIERWKNIARSCVYNKTPYLKFEDWLYEKEIRDDFLWKNFNVSDRYGIEGIEGSQSSFVENGDIDKRYQQVNIPDEIKDLINKDSELHYLIGRLGYEYKKL